MMSAIFSGIGALKTSIDVVKTSVAVRDDDMIASALREMTDRLFDIQQASVLVQQDNLALIVQNKQLVELQTVLEKKYAQLLVAFDGAVKVSKDLHRYALYTTARGGIVMHCKNPKNPVEEAIYLCASCAGEGKKTILQLDTYLWLRCPQHGKVGSDIPDSGPNVVMF